MLVFITVSTVMVLCVSLYVQGRRVGNLREQLDWYEARDSVGDVGVLRNLEGEVRTLHRRIAGLLASPGAYLRARRLLGPLELERDELVKELELIESIN